ncbi:MAG: hypothetical protein AB2385_04390 [Symbiobacterium sp.]|uniref:hypothetical protein n=1 Tax=Symbiobacterium sp. TaxID=1971213 RepID=UPI0034644DBB
MRRLLYALAAAALAVGSLGLALLPCITTHWLAFAVLGACFSAVGGLGWLLGGVAADPLPRLRAGWFLLPAGVIGVIVAAARGLALPLLWAAGEAVTGVLLLVPIFPSQRQHRDAQSGRMQAPGPVQAPPVAGRHESR